MYALGADGLPAEVTVGRRVWRLQQTVKHDFFAAVGFYADDDGRQAVLKVGRTRAFHGVPMGFVGRWLTDRETRAYAKLAGVKGVPALIGRWGEAGFLHDYVPGAPLRRGDVIPVDFFEHLMTLLETLRRAGLTYVDTNKPENVLLGTDDAPWLIDFQIHFDVVDIPALCRGTLGRWLLEMFHRSDVYHVLKHKRRFCPDRLTEAERQRLQRRSWPIRLHRFLTRPYFMLRRPMMKNARKQGRLAPELSK